MTNNRDEDLGAAFWDTAVGPFLDSAGVHQLTAMPIDAIIDCAGSGALLEVTTSDLVGLYPKFQFGADGTLLPGLRYVVEFLKPISDDAWDVALWLVTPSAQFDGQSAAQLLRAGDIVRVLRVAARDGRLLRN